MKKALFLLFFLLPVLSSFALDLPIPNRNVYIEGSASVNSHRTFFMENFTMEATSLGLNVVNNRADAGYIFKFDAIRDGDEFIVLVSLIMTDGNVEVVSFGWPYKEIEEMYEYNQFVFFKAVVLIPGIDEEELQTFFEEELQVIMDNAGPQMDVRWRNKWLYLRASFDFPVTFYLLQPEGLVGGKGVFQSPDGDPNKSTASSPLDNKVMALPALTFGVEVHLLNFISIEPKIMINWEHFSDTDYLNIEAGVEVKFPIKFKDNIVLSPYGAFALPIFQLSEESLVDPTKIIFESYSIFGIGAGIQVNMRAGSSGSFFVDFNYMLYLGDISVKNPYVGLFDYPELIHYNRSVIRIGAGYKFGLINRSQQK